MILSTLITASALLTPIDMAENPSEVFNDAGNPVKMEASASFTPEDKVKMGASMQGTQCNMNGSWSIDDWNTWD